MSTWRRPGTCVSEAFPLAPGAVWAALGWRTPRDGSRSHRLTWCEESWQRRWSRRCGFQSSAGFFSHSLASYQDPACTGKGHAFMIEGKNKCYLAEVNPVVLKRVTIVVSGKTVFLHRFLRAEKKGAMFHDHSAVSVFYLCHKERRQSHLCSFDRRCRPDFLLS